MLQMDEDEAQRYEAPGKLRRLTPMQSDSDDNSSRLTSFKGVATFQSIPTMNEQIGKHGSPRRDQRGRYV